MDSREGSSLVARAFVILGAFRTEPVLGVSDLARRTGLPRTTAHRLANQLLDVGALSRVGEKFRLGPTMFELGNLHYPPRIRETLQPFLDDLQRVSGGDVALLELVGPAAEPDIDRLVNAANTFARVLSLVGKTAEVGFFADAHPKI